MATVSDHKESLQTISGVEEGSPIEASLDDKTKEELSHQYESRGVFQVRRLFRFPASQVPSPFLRMLTRLCRDISIQLLSLTLASPFRQHGKPPASPSNLVC
jgi:hypothetical protein